jgi:hypothetical protein
MTKAKITRENWYDHPKYYDIAFQACTEQEADFIEALCRKYCPFAVSRLLEPACGSGRLMVALAKRGFTMTGFDQSQAALSYLDARLAEQQLHAFTFKGELSSFPIHHVDSAYCLVNTFRHLISEETARSHLRRIATSIRCGGVYILAISLLPYEPSIHWTQARGDEKVTVTQKILSTDQKTRVETCSLRLSSSATIIHHHFQLRSYTLNQFLRLLSSVPSFELCDIYDFSYNINSPLSLTDKIGYGIFVLRKNEPNRRTNQ